MIKVLYFARLREQLGITGEEIAPAAGLETAGDIAGLLQQRGGIWADVLGGDETIMVAVNQEMASSETRIEDGDEVAFFPPVTGG